MTAMSKSNEPVLRKVTPARLLDLLHSFEMEMVGMLAILHDRSVRGDAMLRSRNLEFVLCGPPGSPESPLRFRPAAAFLSCYFATHSSPRFVSDWSSARWLTEFVTGARMSKVFWGSRTFAA